MTFGRNDFAGRVVLVTGAAMGIGKAIALMFAKRGATVVIADRNLAAATTLVEEGGAQGLALSAIEMDVSDTKAITAGIEETVARHGRLDVMVNNAAMFQASTRILDMTEEEWNIHMAVNISGCLFGMQAAGRAMVNGGRGGRIVNMASTAAFRTYPGRSHYCCTKAAVVALTRVGALELAPHGIGVNAVAPGPTATDAFLKLSEGGASGEEGEQMRARMARIPLGMNTPDDIAEATLFLASDAAAKITGQTLIVDGGGTL